MSGREAFELSGATVRYGDLAATDDVSLRIGAGEAVALVGPSGAGKTTLPRLLNGTVRPDAGSVRSLGRELVTLSGRDLRDLRARIGFVPQDFGLVPELRVIQNVTAGRVGRRGFVGALRDALAPSADTVLAAHAVLERVGIPEKLYERTSRLSGGQQQRVAVARALFQSPEALLADEPVSSVDPARARATMHLLTRLAREEGLTLIVSIHHVEIAREFFPRLVGMRGGTVRFDRPTDDLADEDLRVLYDLRDDELIEDGRS
ncbi:ATP-binding cassette domain-containing protein [bacterium]|nr:ATP-binding cassette domain-containing protein [bacterium]